jgi:NAD-dependent deacetylase
MKKKIAVFTGAGMSADSGLKTFRDSGGLWENHRVEDVATPEAWRRNPDRVLRFYNERFHQLQKAEPNEAHFALVKLESNFDVQIITQNVDDLHERAGSSKILHLHGELTKCRSSINEHDVYPMPHEGLKIGNLCKIGSQLRPNIVWFGEQVPAIELAERLVAEADLMIVIGTSLNVYPAAGLVYATRPGVEIIIADPGELNIALNYNVKHLKGTAALTVPQLVRDLINKA